LPTPPTGEQKQKKRTSDVLPKPDNFIRYRQNLHDFLFKHRRIVTATSHTDGRSGQQRIHISRRNFRENQVKNPSD
jgi:hypothetical protein